MHIVTIIHTPLILRNNLQRDYQGISVLHILIHRQPPLLRKYMIGSRVSASIRSNRRITEIKVKIIFDLKRLHYYSQLAMQEYYYMVDPLLYLLIKQYRIHSGGLPMSFH